MTGNDGFPFQGPRFAVGQRVRVRLEYHAALKGVVDTLTPHVVRGVKEETVDRMTFEGQPDEAHYRYQLMELEGVKFPLCSDRFELAV